MALGLRVTFRSFDGKIQGERAVPELPVRLGRNVMNDVSIAHAFISDFHAVIEQIDGRLCLRDLNSRNGTTSYDGNVRAQPEQPLSLADLGNAFLLGKAVAVTVQPFEQRLNVGERASAIHGSILGNAALLDASPAPFDREAMGRGPAAPRPQPREGVPAQQPGWPRAAPASLPPLSLGDAPAVRPAFIRQSDAPGAESEKGHLDALPSLPPVGWGGAPDAGTPRPMPRDALPPRPADARAERAPAHADTGYLQVDMGTLALAGLHELAASLVPGVRLETTGDVGRLLTKLHDLVEVFCRCFVPLREGYAQLASSSLTSRALSRRRRSTSAQRVDAARVPAELAAALLDWRTRDFDAVQAVEESLVEIAAHHAAMTEGTAGHTEALLEELSPESIQRSLGKVPAFNKYRALWLAFEARYAELTGEGRRADPPFDPNRPAGDANADLGPRPLRRRT